MHFHCIALQYSFIRFCLTLTAKSVTYIIFAASKGKTSVDDKLEGQPIRVFTFEEDSKRIYAKVFCKKSDEEALLVGSLQLVGGSLGLNNSLPIVLQLAEASKLSCGISAAI